MMSILKMEYRTKTASERDIHSHLLKCDELFVPPLSKRVVIREYSKKLFDRSITFEAWMDNVLVGLLAAYFENHAGFITNVSVLNEWRGIGIASELITNCIEYARHNKIERIKLLVHKDNESAIGLYIRCGFQNIAVKGDELLMQIMCLESSTRGI